MKQGNKITKGQPTEALGVGYEPQTPADWTTPPHNVQDALDEARTAAGGGGSDTTAIHDNVAAEISLIAEKVTPVGADLLVIEDSAAANAKKRVQITNLPGGGGTDADAIHDNVAGEISLIAEKVTPVAGDLLVIEDSVAANVKRRVQVGNLPGGGIANAFETMVVPDGNNPVASGVDTLNFLNGTATKITGNVAADEITIATRSQVFITAVTGAGTITNKTFEANTVPANKVLTAFESDNDDITVTAEMHVIDDNWQPADVVLSGGGGTPVTVLKQNWSQLVTNARIYTATLNMTDAVTTGTLTATMDDGAVTTVAYTRALDPPLILTAVIDNHPTNTGGDPECPLAQTECSENDQITISGTAEAHATHVYVKDFEVTNGEGLQGPFTIAQFNAGVAINCGTGNVPLANYKIYGVVGVGGTPGVDFISTETVALENTAPNLVLSTIAYPVSQAALKSAENASITVTDSNRDAGDSTLWDDNSLTDFDDLGNAAIANTEALVDAGTYDVTSWNAGVKWVERQATGYRDSGTNVRVTATRLAKNGKTQTLNILVKIADSAPTIDITSNGEGSPKVFRSKTGADKTYTITITSNQELEVAPTLARDAADDGPALGAFSGGSKVWTATLTCQENDTKNVAGATHDFTTLVARNNADVTQNTINSGSAYGVAGFEQRDVAVTIPFDQLEPIGTMVSNRDNINKLVMSYVGLGAGTYVGNTTDDPGSKKFTITSSGGTFDPDGDHIKSNDSNIYDAGVPYTMRIEESA